MLNRINIDSNRGQSVVIGSLLMFGILIIGLSIYQASVVPQQNQQTEFQHHSELRSDMIQYDTTINQTKTLDTSSTTITLSQPYPGRLITVNPPPFYTDLSIGENNPTTVSGFDIRSSGNEAEYWTQNSQMTIPNSNIVADPDYNIWQEGSPIIYENQVVYSETDQLEPVIFDSRSPIQGRQIELHGYTGELSSPTSTEKQVTVKQISSSRHSLYITGENDTDPIQIQINTDIPEITWRQILNVTESENIENVDYDSNSNTLTIELDPSQTYTLDAYLSATNPSDQTESTASPSYIQTVSGEGVLSNQSIILSVHDQLGNKLSGSVVTVSEDPNNCVSFEEKRTNNTGEVTFTCDSSEDTYVTFQINNGQESYETVTVDVNSSGTVGPPGGGPPAGNITASITSIQSTQAGGGPPGDRPYDIQVDWEVTTSDGGSVQSATLVLRDSNGNVIDQRQLSPNSSGDSGQETFRVTGRGTYEATLTAENGSGEVSEDTASTTT